MQVASRKSIKVCRLANSEFFVRHHLEYQVESQIAAGFDVHLVYPKESRNGLTARFPGAKHHFLPFARKPNPFVDVRAFFALYDILKREKFSILHTVTPKAGLLGALVGAIARVPVRIHTFTGQVWATKSGLFRALLKIVDSLIIKLNTKCFADSQSQVAFLTLEKVAMVGDVEVIGAGSLSGFDSEKFCPARFADQRNDIRKSMGFSDGDFVVNYTGRLNQDKGVIDLVHAVLSEDLPTDVKLLLVGPLDGGEKFKKDLDLLCEEAGDRVVLTGYQADPAPYFAASDLFAMPSYREGFGGVLIEAAMMGLPAVATKIPGPIDAVEDGSTGLLINPGHIEGITTAIKKYIKDSVFRAESSKNARARAVGLFDYKVINARLIETYTTLAKMPADR
jgi:glycosyltransferase involved in cell wall biosynthesis